MGFCDLFWGLEKKLQEIIDLCPVGTFEVEEVNPFYEGVLSFGSRKVDSLVHYKSTGGYIRIIPIGTIQGASSSFMVIHCHNWMDWKEAPTKEMGVYSIHCLMYEVLTNS